MRLMMARARMNHQPAPVAGYTAWDPAYKGAGILLSGSNLVATATGSAQGIVRAAKALAGKRYFEVAFTSVVAGTAVIAAGICDGSEASSASLGYSSAHGWAFWGTDAGIRHAGTTLISVTSSQADVIGVAFDAATGSLWFRRNGAWLGGGAPNPAANTAPNYSGILGPVYPAASPWGNSGAIVTGRFDPASFRDAAPAGFDPVAS